jgi:ribosomal protein S18 acetylase RimI-like enzyme
MSEVSRCHIVRLAEHQIELFHSLDRSEVIDGLYTRTSDGLLLRDHHEAVSGWPSGLLEKYLPQWRGAAKAGLPFLGAMLNDKIVGLAVVNPRHRGPVAQLMSLYVDKAGRRRGAATSLCRTAFDLARQAGAKSVYVSSSPARGTVGFYWSMGFRPAAGDDLDPELFALEPNDIHMTRKL